jgi:hypothetical protein
MDEARLPTWLQAAIVTASNTAQVYLSYVASNLLRINTLHVCDPQQHRDVRCSEGNFKEYDADLRRRKGADADTPHRVTYKKLVRS